VTLLLGLCSALAVGFYHMPYHLPLELSLAAAVIVQGTASGRLRVAAAVWLVSGLLTSAALVPWWEASEGAVSVVWVLLLTSLSVMPAVVAVLALGEAVTTARALQHRGADDAAEATAAA
jgi:hypothetical protein